MLPNNSSCHYTRKTVLQLLALCALLVSLLACSNQSDATPSTQSTGSTAGNNANTGGSGGTPSNPTPTAPTTPSTPPPTTAPPPTTPNEPTLAEKIKALEDSGVLPKLDRSADIKGPDANNNGVRDDVDAWIAALPITDKQKKAASQKAAALQRTLLLDVKDKAAMDASGDELAASTNCLWDTFKPNYEEPAKLSSKIEAMTANTKNRAYQYIQYNRAASGSSTLSPDGDTCK